MRSSKVLIGSVTESRYSRVVGGLSGCKGRDSSEVQHACANVGGHWHLAAGNGQADRLAKRGCSALG